jgi:hypothetical protein
VLPPPLVTLEVFPDGDVIGQQAASHQGDNMRQNQLYLVTTFPLTGLILASLPTCSPQKPRNLD